MQPRSPIERLRGAGKDVIVGLQTSLHRLRIGWGVVGAAIAIAATVAPPAFGHAAFLGSTPAPGARLGRSPANVVLRFTEALNPRLSTGALYDAQAGKRLAVRVVVHSRVQVILRPVGTLPRGAYRIEWHSVSADDGHALEGSFSFGVQTAAVGGTRTSQASPVAGLGWARAVVRALLYCALLFFVGALLLGALQDRGWTRPWLLPLASTATLPDAQVQSLTQRYRSLVLDAGLLALALACTSALLDVGNAAGSLSGSAIHDFLLTNTSGLARVAVVVFLALALPAVVITPRAGASSAALALGALALAGHADSASPRAVAVATDWIHLLAAAVWLGGIGLMVATWSPALKAGDRGLRLAVMRHVLPRFGRIALPAFGVVVDAGSLNAYIELGRVSALWDTAYGRILLVKVSLVLSIAAASYVHAMRLRPRLLAARPAPDESIQRRHWQLLRTEPFLAVGTAVAVAFLVAFPVPRDVASAAPSPVAIAPCAPCPLPRPKADELSVAARAGSDVVAAWIRRSTIAVTGEVRVLDIQGLPAKSPFEILGARAITASCGLGCRRFRLPPTDAALRVTVTDQHRDYTARLPTTWMPDKSRHARGLLTTAQAAMRELRSVRETERVSSVPGLFAITDYLLDAPDRSASTTRVLRAGSGVERFEGQQVAVGTSTWNREPHIAWRKSVDRGGLPFRTRTWFTWSNYAEAVRLMDIRRVHGRTVGVLALMDPGTPAWWRLYVDLRTMRVTHSRLVTSGHFMTQRFRAFNRPATIRPPRSSFR